jgi:hypothetical protein
MKWLAWDILGFALLVVLVILAVWLTGCELRIEAEQPACPDGQCEPCPDGECPAEYQPGPIHRLEKALQTPNYRGGSCAHAATIDSLIAQGQDDLARAWRRRFYGGAGVSHLVSAAEKLGVRYAYTSSGDVSFLQWCSRTRRPACIFYKPMHAITFLGFENGDAVMVDNNRPGREERVGREEFLRKWNAYGQSYGYRGGVAFAAVYVPAPPPPRRGRTDGVSRRHEATKEGS